MNDTSRSDDLNWTAFLYISDELSAEERAAFETRFADDQLARDAVCRAVQLAGAASSVLQSEVKTPSPSPGGGGEQRLSPHAGRFAFGAVMAAACLVVAAFALRSWLVPTQSSQNGYVLSGDNVAETEAGESEAEQLVALWTSAETPQSASSEASTTAANSSDGAVLVEADTVDGRGGELEVPDWLFAAVSKELADEDVFGSESDDAPEMN